MPFVTALGYKNGSEPFTNHSFSVACAMNNRTYTSALFSEVLGSFTRSQATQTPWWTTGGLTGAGVEWRASATRPCTR